MLRNYWCFGERLYLHITNYQLQEQLLLNCLIIVMIFHTLILKSVIRSADYLPKMLVTVI